MNNHWPQSAFDQALLIHNQAFPTVRATVDKKRVTLGDEVTFTLFPANVVLDSHYAITLYFGDGRQQRVRQMQITYLYRATGTYAYSILVKPSD